MHFSNGKGRIMHQVERVLKLKQKQSVSSVKFTKKPDESAHENKEELFIIVKIRLHNLVLSKCALNCVSANKKLEKLKRSLDSKRTCRTTYK